MSGSMLTPEEMGFQAAFGHELVHQEELPVLAAVAQQPHQVGMRQPAQEVDLRLHLPNKQRNNDAHQHCTAMNSQVTSNQREDSMDG